MAEKEIVSLENMLPDRLFIVPLSGKPIFPGIFTPLMIVSHQDIATVEKALTKSGGILGLTMLKDDGGEDENPVSIEDLYSVGTVAKIVKKINLPDGGVNIFVSTHKRFKIKKVLSEKDPIRVVVNYLDDLMTTEDFISI